MFWEGNFRQFHHHEGEGKGNVSCGHREGGTFGTAVGRIWDGISDGGGGDEGRRAAQDLDGRDGGNDRAGQG